MTLFTLRKKGQTREAVILGPLLFIVLLLVSTVLMGYSLTNDPALKTVQPKDGGLASGVVFLLRCMAFNVQGVPGWFSLLLWFETLIILVVIISLARG